MNAINDAQSTNAEPRVFQPIQEPISKREYFAAMAMQGILSVDPSINFEPNEAARRAVACADALLNQLNPTPYSKLKTVNRMKWIKASERLPEAISLRTIARYIATKTIVYDFEDFVRYQSRNLKLVEWLDESPEQQQSKPIDKTKLITWLRALQDSNNEEQVKDFYEILIADIERFYKGLAVTESK